MKEKDFQAQIVELVDMLGGLTFHIHDSRREVRMNGESVLIGDAGAKGYPDLTIVTRDRRVIFAELKIGKKQPTEHQWVWLRALPNHQAFLWRPDDWDDAVRIIQEGHRKQKVAWDTAAEKVIYLPLQVAMHEPTCIACQNFGPKPLDIL